MKIRIIERIIGVLLLMTANLYAQGRLYTCEYEGVYDVTQSGAWEDVPEFSVEFEQEFPGNASIGVSAYVFTTNNARMFIRILVDGQPASPSDVVFTTSPQPYSHAFLFSADIGTGQHEVRVQFLSDTNGKAYIADRCLWVVTSPALFNTTAAASGAPVTTTSSSFSGIPSLSSTIHLPKAGDAVLLLSAEALTSSGKRMFVRPLVDSEACEPGDVILSYEDKWNCHTFAFTAGNLSAGEHTVEWQWLVDAGGTAAMGDRTSSIGFIDAEAIQAGEGGLYSISAPSGADVTTSESAWKQIPDMDEVMMFPDNSTALIFFNGEAETSNSITLFARAVLDGSVLEPHDIGIISDGFTGTCSAGFVQPGTEQGSKLFEVQWYAAGDGTCYLGDRNTTVITFPASVTGIDKKETGSSIYSFALHQNYPNPFNPETAIRFDLSQPGRVQIEIINVLGKKIAVLADRRMAAGSHVVTWKGVNQQGNPVPGGVYFCRMAAGTFHDIKKMVLIK